MNTGRRAQHQLVLFARVGWMHFYNGPVPGDERPMGGGSYNETKIGHEVYNFRVSSGRLYGYFQPTMSSHQVALERIDPNARGSERLTGVLIVFVARRPRGGQVVVGWYRDAEVLPTQAAHSPGKPRGYGHFCSAEQRSCVLLPEGNRTFEIPSGRGGMGQSNVCYPLAWDRSAKRGDWIQQTVDFIGDYEGANILDYPAAAAEEESAAATEKALARSQGQGFARTPQERRALEDHAMTMAEKYFRRKGFRVENVAARRSYDLLCTSGEEELHVEVKGTTTDGDAIVLTNNEVKHACDSRNQCALFILHSIHLEGQRASGGKRLILHPWFLKPANLIPVSYTYRIR